MSRNLTPPCHRSAADFEAENGVYKKSFDVKEILERRGTKRGLLLLTCWEGYNDTGTTWEPAEHLPKLLVSKFSERWARYPPSFDMITHDLRESTARALLDVKGPSFGVEIIVHGAKIPEYADALFDFARSLSPPGRKKAVKEETNSTHRLRTFEITDQWHAHRLLRLDDVRPEHAAGCVRIKTGSRDGNILFAGVSEYSPLVLEHKMPLPEESSGALVHGGYSFKVTFCVAGINGYNGDLKPWMVGDEEIQLPEGVGDAMVTYVKTVLKQPWSPQPIPHRLRRSWVSLPAGQWLLPDPDHP